jgi:hypothetical protein
MDKPLGDAPRIRPQDLAVGEIDRAIGAPIHRDIERTEPDRPRAFPLHLSHPIAGRTSDCHYIL